jgi:hypothetical protein
MERPLIVINDHRRIEQVNLQTEEYLACNLSIIDDISRHIWAYYEILDLIPQTSINIDSGHFFPYSEAYTELESSFELCKEGFYRHSLFTLRSVLELGIIGIYFDRSGKSHLEIQSWFKSEDPTPGFKRSLRQLFEIEYFRRYVFSVKKLRGCILN